MQTSPTFEDVDDLLNLPFEDDCLKKLLSDDTNSSGQVGPAHCSALVLSSSSTGMLAEADSQLAVQEGFALQDRDLASGSSDTSRVHFASGAAGSPMAVSVDLLTV